MEIQTIDAGQTHALRHRVLRPMMALADMDYPSDHTDGCVHFGAIDQGQVVGIVTLTVEPSPLDVGGAALPHLRLRGMAVAPEVAGTGVGRTLVERTQTYAREIKAGAIWCNARESALDFYRKCDFDIRGDRFEIEHIGPHFVMFWKA